ncbi:hypothetical protein [Moorena sp. SIO4G3]|uniref:hypothetical protein n=1 Tax=Moorena sp. SIO4G3 TaxID=2607821 RepID=UPI00142B47AA|nr:hypothetical protein [Moorena sp. SIO4G3]NEO82255.1 hypothetical protein [Moorena sp. SIO4G3]
MAVDVIIFGSTFLLFNREQGTGNREQGIGKEWGDGEIGRWGDGEMGRWGECRILLL